MAILRRLNRIIYAFLSSRHGTCETTSFLIWIIQVSKKFMKLKAVEAGLCTNWEDQFYHALVYYNLIKNWVYRRFGLNLLVKLLSRPDHRIQFISFVSWKKIFLTMCQNFVFFEFFGNFRFWRINWIRWSGPFFSVTY